MPFLAVATKNKQGKTTFVAPTSQQRQAISEQGAVASRQIYGSSNSQIATTSTTTPNNTLTDEQLAEITTSGEVYRQQQIVQGTDKPQLANLSENRLMYGNVVGTLQKQGYNVRGEQGLIVASKGQEQVLINPNTYLNQEVVARIPTTATFNSAAIRKDVNPSGIQTSPLGAKSANIGPGARNVLQYGSSFVQPIEDYAGQQGVGPVRRFNDGATLTFVSPYPVPNTNLGNTYIQREKSIFENAKINYLNFTDKINNPTFGKARPLAKSEDMTTASIMESNLKSSAITSFATGYVRGYVPGLAFGGALNTAAQSTNVIISTGAKVTNYGLTGAFFATSGYQIAKGNGVQLFQNLIQPESLGFFGGLWTSNNLMSKKISYSDAKPVYQKEIKLNQKLVQGTEQFDIAGQSKGLMRSTIYEEKPSLGIFETRNLKQKVGYKSERFLVSTGIGRSVPQKEGGFINYQPGEILIFGKTVPIDVAQRATPIKGTDFLTVKEEVLSPKTSGFSGQTFVPGKKQGTAASFGIAFERQPDIFGNPSQAQAIISQKGNKFATRMTLEENELLGTRKGIKVFGKATPETVQQFDVKTRPGKGLEREFYRNIKPKEVFKEQPRTQKTITREEFDSLGGEVGTVRTQKTVQPRSTSITKAVEPILRQESAKPATQIQSFNTLGNIGLVRNLQDQFKVTDLSMGTEAQIKPTNRNLLFQSPISNNILRQSPNNKLVFDNAFKLDQTGVQSNALKQTPQFDVGLRQTQAQDTVFKFGFKFDSGTGLPPPITTKTPVPGIIPPFIDFPKGGSSSFSFSKRPKTKEKRDYTPSLFSTVTKYKGKPTKLDIGGFGLRPIRR